jgi:hypothetical protein
MRLVLAVALALGGCSIINDFSIRDAAVDAESPGDSSTDAYLDAFEGSADGGTTNACLTAQDRAALERRDISVGTAGSLTYVQALLACIGTVQCGPPVALPNEELRTCADECLAGAIYSTPTSDACTACIVPLIDCTRSEACTNPCNFDQRPCVTGRPEECDCDRCLCRTGCVDAFDACTGQPSTFCDLI